MVIRNENRCPTHPGALLREDILPEVNKTKTEIAQSIGISRQQLYDIITEKKPISAEVAVRLAKFFNTTPLFWVNMQSAFDTWNAQQTVDVSNIPVLGIASS